MVDPDIPAGGPPATDSPGGDRLSGELLRRGIGGAGPWHPARQVAEDAVAEVDGDVEAAVRRLISAHVRLAASSGLLTSLGGAATMLITAPAGATGLYLVCTRLAAAIAHARGHDLTDPVVRTAVLLCVLGADGSELAERTGIDLQEVSLLTGLRRLPVEVREQLDRRIGYRLASRAGRRGVLNLTKLIPVVSGPIGAGADSITTRSVATYADVVFWDRSG
ncbi:EcsC family protein [Actinomycetospora termitidis]|uniref:EcsC family protein n=1 Tax=Actinomycetospora termitidis TaxID=3053470 RepID=A0ABT7M2U5_9PSEU|nr:EcsC family protein [Actinomycetospora sp. Odt1-22]MDL5154987.1 EcsC family protein [Actinomycetospora sp. Odt1-22]